MLIYCYDPVTFEFTYAWECQESPLKPGTFIIPENSTVLVPPNKTLDTDTIRYDPTKASWILTPTPIVPVTPLTTAQIIAQLEFSVQQYIDSIAQKKGYDSGISCATYVTSTVATFAADAAAFIKWRDSVWGTCQQLEATDLAATPPIIPTAAAVIAALPAAPW